MNSTISLFCKRTKKKAPTFIKKSLATITTTTANTTLTTNNNNNHELYGLLHTSPTLLHLRHLHARLLRTSLYSDTVLSSKLLFSYSRHHRLVPDSLSVFFHMPTRDIFSWNIIIGEFSRSSTSPPDISLRLFLEMWRQCGGDGVRPDDFTLPLVLRACSGFGDVKFGGGLHGLCVKLGFEGNVYVGSGLVFMYVTFGSLDYARKVFAEMRVRDSVLWTSMLAGYVQHGEVVSGFGLFKEMVGSKVVLDGVVMMSLLSGCGQLGWLKFGKSVHCYSLRKFCFGLNEWNAVVDMYVKCGLLTYARRVFDAMRARDVLSWSSLILGYGLSGNVDMVLQLFDQMISRGIKPNDVTFLGVLSGCAHGGLVEQARSCFQMMREYGVVPELKHYSVMIDCLGRGGFLEEAEQLIEGMPMDPDSALLASVLAGCCTHNNFKIGERIAKKLIRLKPEKAGYYVLLANIYAAVGKFDDAELVREFMRDNNVTKVPGLSLIESNTCLHSNHSIRDFLEIG